MSISAGWYTKNAARAYPLSPNSTGKDDSGNHIPEQLLADLRIRFTGEDEEKLYISSVDIGSVVSIVFTSSVTFEPVALISVARPAVVSQKIYEVVTINQDATGYVVFGDITNLPEVKLRFSSSAQSEVSILAAYPQPVSTVDRRFAGINGRLDGVYPMYLFANSDIVVRRRTLELENVEREAIVLSLTDPALTAGTFNSLSQYAGECGRRPESNTCPDPQPIELINGVEPDCCGRIFIEIRGCGDMLPLQNVCGVAIVCSFEVDDSCPPKVNLPSDTGRLPSEFSDDCGTIPVKPDTNLNPGSKKWWEIIL
jgi:hypothetical protein